MNQPKRPPIVLFDGVCNLCHASVNFILDRDPRGIFHFASLQSDVGRSLLERVGADPNGCDSVILIDGDKVYHRSSAALRIAQQLQFPWPLMTAFLVVPRFLRDAVYNFIARNRYHWFGRSVACRLPSPQSATRFLSESDIDSFASR